MWFIKNQPTHIDMESLIESLPMGYQLTNLKFTVKSHDNSPMRIAVPFPWSPHKKDGSLSILNETKIPVETDSQPFTIIENVTITGKLRSLKNEDDIDMILVHDLLTWHLDDIGVFTFWVDSGVEYSVNYKHKIAADSQLFLPTRLPIPVIDKKPIINWKCWVVNANPLCLPKNIKIERVNDDTRILHFQEGYKWNEDTRVSTFNWESSDDDFGSGSETESETEN